MEIVVDDPQGSDSEDEDESMSDDDDMDDDDDEGDIHEDELPPGVQHDLAYQDEEDWEASDNDGGDDLVEMLPPDQEGLIDHVNRVIAGGDPDLAEELMEEREDGFIEDPEEDDEDEEEEEELEEEEAVAQDDEREDDEDDLGIPWEWTDDYGDAPLMARARHPNPQSHGWYTLGGTSRDIIRKFQFFSVPHS